MKIIFIGQKGIPSLSGGVEKHVEELTIRLVNLGHDVSVYTRSNYNKGNNNYRGVKLIRLPSLPTKNFDAISHTFLACLDLIFKRKVDIIHFHSIGPSSLIWLVKLFKPKTPIIATFHTQCYYHKKWGFFARTYLKFGEFMCCRLADKVIVISKNLKVYTKNKYKREVDYVPNGVSLSKILPLDEIEKKWDIKNNNYFLSVSRLVRHKGIHYLIEAYKKLNTNKKLVIVGGGSFTDKYVKELKKLADGNKNIIFTNIQSGKVLFELFSNAYCFVQPSESEGLSIALLEAMSYGKAVLVSDIPENKEAIGEAGFTFKNKDIGDLSKKLNYLLNNLSAIDRMGKLGKRRVAELYNLDSIVDSIVDIYRQAIFDKQKNFKLLDYKYNR